jgi:hypothetical protein
VVQPQEITQVAEVEVPLKQVVMAVFLTPPILQAEVEQVAMAHLLL